MLTSSTNSSCSSSVSSSERHLPYQHPTPLSVVSLGSQHSRKPPMPTKYPRFYSSPLEEGPETPLQVYGLEEREPSIMEKPNLLHRVSHALDDIKEDFSLYVPHDTANKIKRRSTLLLDGHRGPSPRRQTGASPPWSRPMSIISVEGWSSPPSRLGRHLSRRLSIFSSSSRKAGGSSKMASISSPNLLGSSTQYGGERGQSYI